MLKEDPALHGAQPAGAAAHEVRDLVTGRVRIGLGADAPAAAVDHDRDGMRTLPLRRVQVQAQVVRIDALDPVIREVEVAGELGTGGGASNARASATVTKPSRSVSIFAKSHGLGSTAGVSLRPPSRSRISKAVSNGSCANVARARRGAQRDASLRLDPPGGRRVSGDSQAGTSRRAKSTTAAA